MRYKFSSKTASRLLAATAFLSVFAFAGCDEHVTSERNPEVPIPKHATWAWRPVEAAPTARDTRPVISRDVISPSTRMIPDTDTSNEFLRGQIRAAIAGSLSYKGYREVKDPQAADFLVDYHVAVKDQKATVPAGYAAGYPGVVCGPYGCWQSWGWGPPALGYETIRFRAGTMVFDFVQASTKKVAFRSIGDKPVKSGFTTFRQKDVNSLVHALLWKLPSGK